MQHIIIFEVGFHNPHFWTLTNGPLSR